jgi:hypothetical protein
LEVEGANASSDGLTIKVESARIGPGEVGWISVELHPDRLAQTFAETIEIETSDPARPIGTIRISGRVEDAPPKDEEAQSPSSASDPGAPPPSSDRAEPAAPSWRLEPPELELSLQPGLPFEYWLSIANVGTRTLAVLEVTALSPAIVAKVETPRIDPGGRGMVSLLIDATRLPDRFAEAIEIETDDPEVGSRTFRLFGKVSEAEPAPSADATPQSSAKAPTSPSSPVTETAPAGTPASGLALPMALLGAIAFVVLALFLRRKWSS